MQTGRLWVDTDWPTNQSQVLCGADHVDILLNSAKQIWDCMNDIGRSSCCSWHERFSRFKWFLQVAESLGSRIASKPETMIREKNTIAWNRLEICSFIPLAVCLLFERSSSLASQFDRKTMTKAITFCIQSSLVSTYLLWSHHHNMFAVSCWTVSLSFANALAWI